MVRQTLHVKQRGRRTEIAHAAASKAEQHSPEPVGDRVHCSLARPSNLAAFKRSARWRLNEAGAKHRFTRESQICWGQIRIA
jgi:hypothetical protein